MRAIVIPLGLICLLLLGCGQDEPVPSGQPETPWQALEPVFFECVSRGYLGFERATRYFVNGDLRSGEWSYHSQTPTSEDFLADSEANVLIEGDCTSQITLPFGGMIIIKGDLIGKLDLKGPSEVIIAGDIAKDAIVENEQRLVVLVGGDVNGRLINSHISLYFVKGNLNGHVVTGDPHTDIYVCGDCTSSFAYSGERGSLVDLTVKGFMPLTNIEQFQKLYYCRVKAFVQESDSKRGILPTYGYDARQTWYVKSQKAE